MHAFVLLTEIKLNFPIRYQYVMRIHVPSYATNSCISLYNDSPIRLQTFIALFSSHAAIPSTKKIHNAFLVFDDTQLSNCRNTWLVN